MKRFILLDGNAIIHRAFHALPPLTTSKGIPINAVYGFTSMLLKVFKDLTPDYVACTFDLKAPTFRHKEYKEYKATRPKMAEELVGQIPLVHQVVKTLNIPIFEMEGFEADDIIGTLAFQAKTNRLEVIIVTGDRDSMQLVDKNTKVYCPIKGLSNPVLYDEALVTAKYGLTPSQLIDYKTLMGDPSDNIPGIEGIGPKTAASLLQKYGTIEELYKNLDSVESQSVREKLKTGEKGLILSKRLVTIVRDAPITLDLEKCQLMDYNREEVVALFRDLEFNTLIPRLPMDVHEFKVQSAKCKVKNEAKKTKENKDQLGLF